MQRSKRVVLVVEDDWLVGELLAAAISEEPGFRAIHVTDASAALETAHQVTPDLFVLDVRLPGMSGLELYDHLRRDERTKNIPVLFETGGDIPGSEFRKRGVAAYLKKPFDLHEVVRYVKLLATRRQLAQARP